MHRTPHFPDSSPCPQCGHHTPAGCALCPKCGWKLGGPLRPWRDWVDVLLLLLGALPPLSFVFPPLAFLWAIMLLFSGFTLVTSRPEQAELIMHRVLPLLGVAYSLIYVVFLVWHIRLRRRGERPAARRVAMIPVVLLGGTLALWLLWLWAIRAR